MATQNIDVPPQAAVVVEPEDDLFDAKTTITIKGLQPGQSYEVELSAEDDNPKSPVTFSSFTSVQSDAQGTVVLGSDDFRLMVASMACVNVERVQRFARRKAVGATSFRVIVWAKESTTGASNEGRPGRAVVACATYTRRHLQEGTEVVYLTSETPMGQRTGLRGTLFVPPRRDNRVVGDCFPVLEWRGAAGGLIESRGGLLAGHGFLVLSLAYYRFDDLPTTHEHLDLNYFVRGGDLLVGHERAIKDAGYGAISTSYGTVMASMLAVVDPRVRGVVSLVGAHWLAGELTWSPSEEGKLGYPWKYVTMGRVIDAGRHRVPLKISPEGVSTRAIVTEGLKRYNLLDEGNSNSDYPIIPVERSKAKFLCICGDDDQQYDASVGAGIMQRRLVNVGRGSDIEILKLKGTGHLIEAPYLPHTKASYHQVLRMLALWGGEPDAQSKAEVIAWSKVLAFFNSFKEAEQKEDNKINKNVNTTYTAKL